MRVIAGLAIFIAGLAILSLWAAKVSFVLIEKDILQSSIAALQNAPHGLQIKVSGRDIHLQGVVDTEGERAFLLRQADMIAGRRRVVADLQVLPTYDPYKMSLIKAGAGEDVKISGYVPSPALIDTLVLQGQDITLVRGAPPLWAEQIKTAKASLSLLSEGVVLMENQSFIINGTLADPQSERLLRGLLAQLSGVDLRVDVALADDGRAPAWRLDYDAKEGAEISGKLPLGLRAEDLAQALGLKTIKGRVVHAQSGARGDVAVFSALADWLPQLEVLKLQWSETAARAWVEGPKGLDVTGLEEALKKIGFSPDIKILDANGAEGARRLNAASQLPQVFMGGYWLVEPEVIRTAKGCQEAVAGAWRGRQLQFDMRLAKYDDRFIPLINDLARHMRACSALPALKAEISVEGPRLAAEVLRDELIARGVRAGALVVSSADLAAQAEKTSMAADGPETFHTSILWLN